MGVMTLSESELKECPSTLCGLDFCSFFLGLTILSLEWSVSLKQSSGPSDSSASGSSVAARSAEFFMIAPLRGSNDNLVSL